MEPPAGSVTDREVTRSDIQRLTARAGWSLVWFGTLMSGLGAWAWWSSWPGAAVIAPLIVAVGIVGTAAGWLVERPEGRRFAWLSLAISCAAAAFAQGITIMGRSFYTTDSAAFNQIAAAHLLKGRNPYTASLAGGASHLLQGVASYWTYTLGGGHIDAVSYPAGSFVFQVPLQWLGVTHLATDWLDLLAGIVATVLLFAMLPMAIRWLAPALLVTGNFLGLFSNGGTDALVLPFLLLAVWKWDRHVDPSCAWWMRWIGPVALGIACSIKQSPWFCVPFLILGIVLEARSTGRPVLRAGLGYGAVVVGTFMIIDLPFLIWSPHAWIHGVFLPLAQPLIPDGQGLVTLALHGFVHGAHPGSLAIAGVFAEVALLAAFFLEYRRFKPIWLFLVPLVLFFPGRSLSEYLMDFFPAAIVAACSVRRTQWKPLPNISPTLRGAAMAAPVLGVAAFSILGLSSPVLTVRVVGTTTQSHQQFYRSLTLELVNNSDVTIRPGVMVLENGTHPTGFWHLAGHRALTLRPHARRVVTVYPPTWTWTSLKGQYWIVAAYTSTPAGVSTSPAIRWNQGRR